MIAYLKGLPLFFAPDHLVLDVHDVGYLLHMTTPDLEVARAAADRDEALAVHVYTHVREEQFTLFAFLDPLSRTLFTRLIAINGVGPKMALALLSTFHPAALRQVAFANDLAALKKVPGVGAKTAQRLVIELQPMLQDMALPTYPTAGPRARAIPAAPTDLHDELRSALLHLGFPEPRVAEALQALAREEAPPTDFDVALKSALSWLKKR